jgi:three-Cys-motif partner protein
MSSKPTYVLAQDSYRALQVKLHTREKLHYIRRYIDQFCTATKQRWSNRNYIDLFSGPGINVYEVNAEEDKSACLEALSHKYPFTSYFINDIDAQSISALQQRIGLLQLSPKINITLQSLDCNHVVNQFVSTVKAISSVNLAILDGFGIECHWETVKKLASIDRMDLVILFPGNMNVVRNAERWSQEHDAQLDQFMPDRSWRKVWTDRRLAGGKAAADLLKLYIEGLEDLKYRGDGLIRSQLIKSESGQPLYHLIFASRHPLGGKFWQQATGKDDEGQMSLPL